MEYFVYNDVVHDGDCGINAVRSALHFNHGERHNDMYPHLHDNLHSNRQLACKLTSASLSILDRFNKQNTEIDDNDIMAIKQYFDKISATFSVFTGNVIRYIDVAIKSLSNDKKLNDTDTKKTNDSLNSLKQYILSLTTSNNPRLKNIYSIENNKVLQIFKLCGSFDIEVKNVLEVHNIDRSNSNVDSLYYNQVSNNKAWFTNSELSAMLLYYGYILDSTESCNGNTVFKYLDSTDKTIYIMCNAVDSFNQSVNGTHWVTLVEDTAENRSHAQKIGDVPNRDYSYFLNSKIQINQPENFNLPNTNYSRINNKENKDIILLNRNPLKQLITNFLEKPEIVILENNIINTTDSKKLIKKENASHNLIKSAINSTELLTSDINLSNNEVFKKLDTPSSNLHYWFLKNDSDQLTDNQSKKLKQVYQTLYQLFLKINSVENSQENEVESRTFKAMLLFTNLNKDNDTVDMILVETLKNLMSFINSFASNLETPIHDICQYNFSTNISNVVDWKHSITAKLGVAGIRALVDAQSINEFLKEQKKTIRMIKTPDNLKTIMARFTYKNSATNHEFATLCMKYNISEFQFNKMLHFEKNLTFKKKDKLPNITIWDKANNLVWMKLPFNDKLPYVLGNIVQCCQHVDGNSEQCVIDGMTRENNGFYVLVKINNKNNSTNLTWNNIKESATIVAQSYVWNTKHNNLCLDSIEVHPNYHNEKIVKL